MRVRVHSASLGAVLVAVVALATVVTTSHASPQLRATATATPTHARQLLQNPGEGLTWGEAAMDEAVSMVKGVPDCLKRAVAVMCRHYVLPVEQCLEDPEYVATFIQYDAHITAPQKSFRKRIQRSKRAKVDFSDSGNAAAGFVQGSASQIDITDASQWIATFGSRKGATHFRAEHVFDYVQPMKARVAAAMSYLFLAPGGRFRVSVADGYLPSERYHAANRPAGKREHLALHNVDTLPADFTNVGYHVELREYFDKHGKFHNNEAADDEGWGPLHKRTSTVSSNDPESDSWEDGALWFDAVKPEGCPVWKVAHTLPKHVQDTVKRVKARKERQKRNKRNRK